MTARQLEDIHEAIVVVEVPAQGQTELVWSKYSNAHRVSSLHLSKGCLNPPSCRIRIRELSASVLKGRVFRGVGALDRQLMSG